MKNIDEKWMKLALKEAEAAAELGEVPIGAVIVRGDEVIASAHNLCHTKGLATAHAEVLAIDEACRKTGGWRLADCTLYVTLEPCPMCAGAAINARIPRVVFAAKDPRMGACGSLLDLSAYPLEIRPEYVSRVLEHEALDLLHKFFVQMRKNKK